MWEKKRKRKVVLWTLNHAFPLNYEKQMIAYNVLVSHSIIRIPCFFSLYRGQFKKEEVVSYNPLMCDLSRNLARPNSIKEGVVNYNYLKWNLKWFSSLLQATGLKRERERGTSNTSFWKKYWKNWLPLFLSFSWKFSPKVVSLPQKSFFLLFSKMTYPSDYS